MKSTNRSFAVAFTGLGVALFAHCAVAKTPVDQTLETTATPNVQFEHVSGKAVIKGWDKKLVQVKGELGDKTEEFTFEKDGNDVVINVETNHRHIEWEDKNTDDGDNLTIFIPRGSRISYTSVVADVDVSELTGDTELEVVNGDIKIKDLSGRTKLETVNGGVEFRAIRGELSVESVNGDIQGEHEGQEESRFITVNGNIDLRSQSKRSHVETVNGKADLSFGDIQELELITVNGRFNVGLTLLDGGELEGSSVGGEVHLNLQPDVSARFDIQAHAGGDIVNRLSADKAESAKYGPSEWLDFSLNGGSGSVELSTVHGSVILDKKS